MPGSPLGVGFVHGDVQAGEADGLTRGGEAPGVAELGQDRARHLRADAVVAHQRPAAGLAARERIEFRAERRELCVDVIDHGQRELDLSAPCRRELERVEVAARVAAVQARGGGSHAVVEQHGVDTLQPLGALVDQRLAQTHQCAQFEDVLGRDPRLWQPPLEQQFAQVTRVAAVGPRAPLGSAPCARFAGSARNTVAPARCNFLDDEAPARGRFNGRLDAPAIPALEEATQAVAVCGRDAPALHLAGGAVERVEGDLATVNVEADYDRHENS